MKTKLYFFLLLIPVILLSNRNLMAVPKVTLTTNPVVAANINQGATGNIVYVVKMAVTTDAVTINNMQFTLSGTQDNNDLSAIYLYYNATAPTISGAAYLGGTTTILNAPHTYSIAINRAMVAGETGYYMVTVNISTTATDNHTVQINGATNPVVFGYSVSTTLTNNQSNKADPQTIQAADVTLTTNAVAAADVNQGATGNIIYVAKMNVKTEPAIVNNMTFTLSGTQDFDDLSAIYLYYNATAPTLSGAAYLGGTTTIADAPHTYSIGVYRSMSQNETGYYMVTVNVSATAKDNHNVTINGATSPIVFGFSTAPNITNNQANKADKLTIQAADITLTTNAVAAADVNQGATGNIIYVAKMNVKTEPVIVNNMTFTLSGSQDFDDLSAIYLYYNATAPVISGASYLGGTTTIYDAPHTYSVNMYRSMVTNETGYYIISFNVSNTAKDNHNVFIDGAADPVVFGYSTAPNVTNSQTNKAKKQTFQAADITYTTSATSAGNIARSSTGNILYALKSSVKTEPVIVNNMTFTISGSQDNDDLTAIYLYYNATAPTLSGASYLGGTTTIYDAPHTYSVNIYRAMAINETGYFMITVNVSGSANVGHTVRINGATDPVVLSYVTEPNITDNQSNNAGTKTISATFAVNGNNGSTIDEVSSDNIVSGVYPNPANSSFTFSITAQQNGTVKAQLSGRSGNVMQEKNLIVNKGLTQSTFNVSTIPNGIYYLTIFNKEGGQVAKQQVVVQH